jgi:peptidoglycan hydrolase-like protein with peptidoglycan-binding domain
VTLSQQTIVAVQQALSHLGYYRGPIDGFIGSQTAKAVRFGTTIAAIGTKNGRPAQPGP